MLCLYLVNQPYHFLHITIFFYINKMYIYFYKKITLLTLNRKHHYTSNRIHTVNLGTACPCT